MRFGGLTGWRLGVLSGLALLVLGPAVWFIHLSILYALVPPACRAGTDLPHHVATGGALVALAVTGVFAGRRWRHRMAAGGRTVERRAGRAGPGDRRADEGSGTGTLLDRLLGRRAWRSADGTGSSMAVALVSVLYFALVVAMTGAVPLVVHRCA